MAFPYNQENQPLNEQGILAGVAGVSAGAGAIRVSSITATASLTFDGDAANNRVSAFQTAAGSLHVSAKSQDGALFRVSAIQEGAGALMVSAKSNDAALLRMSAIGGTAGDNTLVDGITQTVSAVIVSSHLVDLSGLAASARRALIITPQVEDAAENAVSAKSGDAGTLLVSAKQGDGALLRVSAVQDGAAALNVSAKSNDGALFRVSGIIDNGSVSAKSSDAGTHLVSAKQGDAALLRVSAIVDNGSVSAKSSDAGTLLTSAKQGDAANLRASAILQPDAATKLSMFSTSAGIAQLSAIKASQANLYGYQLMNKAGSNQWLHIFNASATSAVTLGTTIPAKSVGVPATGGANLTYAVPPTFAQGIVIAVVSAEGGTTAGASAMTVNLDYL